MDRSVSLRTRIGQGSALRGLFVSLPEPSVVEILGASGVDFLCLEGEHSALRGQLLVNMLRAADLMRVPTLVRVAEGKPWLIAEALDAGAAGILVPRVSTAAQAVAAVRAARFPPDGDRGAGPGRAAGYGYNVLESLERARAETVVAVQIETVEAMENLDAILAVSGIDLVFIGPGDLAISLAAAGSPGATALAAAIERITGCAHAAGQRVGLFTPGEPAADPRVTLHIQGSDAMLLGAAAIRTFGPARTGVDAQDA